MKRKLWHFENDTLRISVAEGGGHIAALSYKGGPNPLWTPPWKSIEPATYNAKKHDRVYGGVPEGPLLSGILGHNLALDIFGTPSPAEVRAGGLTHGEAGVAVWKRVGKRGYGARLPHAQLTVARTVGFHETLPILRVSTRVKNTGRYDRPIAWNEHVTFGPPFLSADTRFEMPAHRAMVFPADFGADSHFIPGREFIWPNAPLRAGGTFDHQLAPRARRAADFTTQLFDASSDTAWFTATNPKLDLSVGYLFRRADFPWIGVWDEKFSRASPPWNRETWARGMEFSTTPLPGSRRDMISQSTMFDTPTYRWIEAGGEISTEIVLFCGPVSGNLHEEGLRFLNKL